MLENSAKQQTTLLSQTQNAALRRRGGTALHFLATFCYIAFTGGVIVVALEIMKGFEILPYIKDPWLSFGGARESFSLTILVLAAGIALDRYAKKLNPKLKREQRGWPYYD